jgi:site-specific DNA-methyltransferase (adenine-specific)
MNMLNKLQHIPNLLVEVKEIIDESLTNYGVAILPSQDVTKTISLMKLLEYKFDVTMLDPWYNKGFGGIQSNYLSFFLNVIRESGRISEHVYFWGFPEIVAPFVERIPEPLNLTCWLTWYYKNNPSVIRGWRSSQNACLHLSRNDAKLYPERFLNEKQCELAKKGKLRYMPGPTSIIESAPEDMVEGWPEDVIEYPLLVGFVGRKEQTGHPAQKPFKVYDYLLKMTTSNNGLILDPMCGSGTTGAVAKERGYRTILCDNNEDYIKLTEKRLCLNRLDIKKLINEVITEVSSNETSITHA